MFFSSVLRTFTTKGGHVSLFSLPSIKAANEVNHCLIKGSRKHRLQTKNKPPCILNVRLKRIYITCILGSIRLSRCRPLKRNRYTTCSASVVVNISASGGCLSSAVGSVDVWCSVRRSCHGRCSNLASGKIFTASIGSVDSLYVSVFAAV